QASPGGRGAGCAVRCPGDRCRRRGSSPGWRRSAGGARPMSRRPRWTDAADALARLGEAERRGLGLLGRLALVEARLLAQLCGHRGPAASYRTLGRVLDEGLADRIELPLGSGRSPGLWHLTDLGLATLTLDEGAEPAHLARRYGLRRRDLLALLPGLLRLAACHELLAALAASRPGPPELLAWER